MIRCLPYFEQAGIIMKTTRSLTVILICLIGLAVTAEAQKKPVKRPVTRRPVTTTRTTNTSTLPPLEVRAARVKVSNQLSNVDLFISKLGPIAQNIEDLDNQARTRKISKTSIDTNEANKKKVIDAIRGLRDGIVKLETEFRTKNDLKKYLTTIQGISDLAAQSQDAAFAGKFVASQDPLKSISRKLTNTLAAMPNAEL